MKNKVKVLIVDDSSLVRKILSDIINESASLELVGIAQNGNIALRKIDVLKPDIITLDVEMPELDGFGVLKEMIKLGSKAKVIMVSGVTRTGANATLKALEMGAVDFVTKPSGRMIDLQNLSNNLLDKIHEIAKIDYKQIISKISYDKDTTEKPIKKSLKAGDVPDRFIAIGTSTGGPQALKEIFQDQSIPEECAYIIVQHMPEEFTSPFAERLNQISKINVKEATQNEPILTGWAYIAPGHSHMEVQFTHNKPFVKLHQNEKVSGHRPSIDVLFESVANCCPKNTLALIMTGMGRDGAKGIKAIKELGGDTIAQDKESSIVFGMNKEAISLGGIEKVVSLKDIPKILNSILNNR